MTPREDTERQKPFRDSLRVFAQYALVVWAVVVLCSRSHLLKVARESGIPPVWLFIGPAIFLTLFVLVVILQFSTGHKHKKNLGDLLPLLFGLLFFAVLFQSSVREYNARVTSLPLDISFLNDLSHNQDARIRALAILAAFRNNLADEAFSALLHRGLLDNDPLVQQAARMVIEDNLGIRLKNGDEGLYQAQELIRQGLLQALLMEKGVP